jgi:hypothetical protein
MAKYSLLELLQGWTWLNAKLVDEKLPRLAVNLERFNLAI